ncbi:hypothetical protein [Pedobacter sp. SL55]|uniref:hypothetical protein n=1 Tax=Pedobacter sp. SL55 TaxID=2995161 RepID=UPI0022711C86|nr:hypothetical protein [Pedobacter sp. SL55]WAC40566.1 hypothetical protein OVA16_18675 [Pedobacter sp. SL55]
MITKDLDDLYSFRDTVVNNIISETYAKWNAALEKYVSDNLERLGYKFEHKAQFYAFCTARVSKISTGSDEWVLYLDWDDENKTGQLIGSFSQKVEITHEENTIKATIGRNLGK